MKREPEYTKNFQTIIRNKGWKFRQATKSEDMYDHIDCHVTIMNGSQPVRSLSIDLKGTKYNSRKNEGIDDYKCQYIEFLNVRGAKGWLFGKADYIAIEEDDKFLLIKRSDLIRFCEKLFGVALNGNIEEIESKLLNVNAWVKRSDQSHHKLYRRWKRQDIVTQINMADVKSLAKITI